MRILLFILISTGCFGQIINNNIMLKKSSSDTVAIPYPFLAYSVDTDSIRTEWIDIGAENYVLESDDNDDFSSPTTEYSGTNTAYTLTGLGANVKRYFRLHAETDGLVNSPYVYDSATTFPFTPVAFYEGTGIALADNRYFDYSGSGVTMDSVLSVINYSGPSLYTTSTKGAAAFVGENRFNYVYYAHNTLHTPTTNFVFGDFEINFWIKIIGGLSTSIVFGNSGDATQYIRFNSYSQIRFARTTGVTLTLTNTLVDGVPYFLTFQRSGTTFTVIVRDATGTIVETQSGTCVNTSITFDRIFFASSKFWMGRLCLMDRALTSDERNAVYNYTKRSVLTNNPVSEIKEVKGLTMNSFTGPYLINTDFANTMVSSFTRDRFFGYGDYQFALTSKKFASPEYGEDLLYAFKNDNQVSNPISLGVPSTTEDVHNSGGICFWNDMVVHFEQDKHYDDGGYNTLVVKMFGKDMNMVGYKRIPLGKGVVTHTGPHLQYHQVCIINNKIYITAQEWSGSGGNAAHRIVLLISDDGWNFFEKYQIAETDDGDGDFLYHQMLYSEDKIIVTIDHEVQPGNDHRASYILVCDPAVNDKVFYNVAGTTSKNIFTSGPLTLTELDANYLLGTAITGSPGDLTSVKQSHGLYDPGSDEAYVVRFNGNDDGLVLCEVDFTAETITEYAIPETIDGHTIDVSCVGSGATNQPFVYKDGSTYYLICGEVNSGNTKIIRCSSTDGTTWSYVDQLSTDDTKPHIRIMPTKNWYYTTNRKVFASRDQTTYGDLFVYTIAP